MAKNIPKSEKFIENCREIVLGEHTTDKDPDCPKKKGPGSKGGTCAPKKIVRKAEEIIIHEDYKTLNDGVVNDIALIRLSEPVPLFSEEPTISNVIPVCLSWNSDDPGRDLQVRVINPIPPERGQIWPG